MEAEFIQFSRTQVVALFGLMMTQGTIAKIAILSQGVSGDVTVAVVGAFGTVKYKLKDEGGVENEKTPTSEV